jgi:CubicO group peptidase (beta-lactamase class C family)
VTDLRLAAAASAELLRSAVADGRLPSAAFGVAVVGEGVVVADSFGDATVDTPFSLASTTKPVATTVLGALLDRGVMSLDDEVTVHVPEFGPALVPGRPVTVRDLAAHTSGLGTHHRFFYVDERPSVSLADAIRTWARPALPVGAQWRYSNLGYGVLQLAMERAAGMTMEQLVSLHVYEPLSMRSAAWGGAVGPPGAASRHLDDRECYPGYVTDHPAASEAWCSLRDLLQFGAAHASASLLHADTHALLARPAAPVQADGAAYALGWVTREYGGHRLLVHAGRMGGVAAHLTVVPSCGLVVAALANRETELLAQAVAVVLAACVPEYETPVPTPPWVAGRAHVDMRRRWVGELVLGDDRCGVVLDASGERITWSLDGAEGEVIAPHVQPTMVAGHVQVQLRHPLVPVDSIGHLDLVQVGNDLVGGLALAQYPNERRRRQGDTVTAAVLMTAR